jgi:two-component system chemotaxis response regulator CheY
MVAHCLIVDDAKIVRRLTRSMLEEWPFSIDEAEDGKVAMGKVKEQMPDVILLDWNMPNMNGLEFLKWLRQEADGGDTPVVIFCTTETELSYIQDALMSGANEYVMKPFDNEILKSKLEMLDLL